MKTLPILFALALSSSVLAAPPAAPANPHAGMTPHKEMLSQSGKVLSTIAVPSYTYVEVAQGKKTLWLAATTSPVKKGDMVRFDDGMVMNNFYSKSLKRSFPSIVFVNSLVVDNGKK
ncbi:MAG: NrfJ-related protein [Thiobacillus sp.]